MRELKVKGSNRMRDNILSITESGRVFRDGSEMVPSKNNRGYLTNSYGFVHRLVAEAYIPNPSKLPCVNHKDRDRTNNYVTNLEWCTYSANSVHAIGITSKVVSPSGDVMVVDAITTFARNNGICREGLRRVIKKVQKTYKGWRLYEET